MNDDRNRLEQLLTDLRAQLAASTTLDASMRRRLEQTLGEVQQALSSPAATGKPGQPLGNRLSEAAIGFEVSHPALANTLGSLIEALAQMGI